MKKLFILFILILFGTKLMAPPDNVTEVYVTKPDRPYDKLWGAVCQVESGGNPLAVGDKHLKKHSYGIAQIRESRLRDYNRRTSANYSVVDLFDVEISKKIFYFYCQGDYETCAKAWNGSGPATEVYWKKIQKYLRETKRRQGNFCFRM